MSKFFDLIYNYYDSLSTQNKIVFYGIIFFLAITFLLIILSLISQRRKKEEIKIVQITDEPVEINNEVTEIAKKIEQDLETGNIDLTEYEDDQENTSIISYQELLAVAKKTTNEIKQKEEEKEEELSQTKTFKPSEFISPVYGCQKEERKKETVSINKTDAEKFLSSLKSFRNNLEE